MWAKKAEGEKRNPLPSVAASHCMSEDSVSLTSSTADNPQITGSYFIISCRSVPRLSSPLWLSDMWREREWERESKEESERYWRSRRRTVDGWEECTVCVTEVVWASAEKENIALMYCHGVWLQSENVKSWTPGSPWIKEGCSLYSRSRADQQRKPSYSLSELSCL